MELTGLFKSASEIKTFTGSDFKVQEFYLDCQKFNSETGEPIPNLVKLQASGNKIDLLNGIAKGDKIKVSFNVKGRLFDKQDGSGKAHAQNLDIWKLEVITKANAQQSTAVQPSAPTTQVTNQDDDDLPF